MCSPRAMAEEEEGDVDTRLGLAVGGGERRPPVQLEEEALMKEAERSSTEESSGKDGEEGEGAGRRGVEVGDDRHGGGGGARKKLRLTGEQAALLEESFRAHNVVSHHQKHELAGKLNLSPRQVEVWFQNRRARTKLKQTEVDCDLLKRCCERLADENRRLRHELMELRRSARAAAGRQLSVQFPAVATAKTCPSCEMVADLPKF